MAGHKIFQLLVRYRVRINTALFVLAFLLCRYEPLYWLAGMCVTFVGLFFRAWAAGIIKKDETLATSGPYSLVRHPLYLGSIFVFAGFIIGGKLFLIGAILFPLFLASHLLAARAEEEKLAELFKEYGSYRSKVPFIVPVKFSRIERGSWSFNQVLNNKEVNLWIAVIIYFLWVWIKGNVVSKF